MHLLAGLLSAYLIATMLAEFFVVFLLPRRVKRDPRIARGFLRSMWIPWRRLARRLPRAASETMLGIFGPLGLITILAVLSAGMILGFAGLHWAGSTRMGSAGRHPAAFGEDLYFSAGAFFSASTPSFPTGGFGRLLQILEAVAGFSFLAIAIGYLPALFQAFSRRETAVSRLDPRAGSPPTAGALLGRSGRAGGWEALNRYLREWETWTAELMETHLSYPVLGYFRSQHVNQNWLAALTTVVDSCAYAIAFGPPEEVESARLTFRIGRHALADLAHAFSKREVARAGPGQLERLSDDALSTLQQQLEGSHLHSTGGPEARARLHELRDSYEPYALAISRQLALELPDWLSEDVQENWRAATDRDHAGHQLHH